MYINAACFKTGQRLGAENRCTYSFLHHCLGHNTSSQDTQSEAQQKMEHGSLHWEKIFVWKSLQYQQNRQREGDAAIQIQEELLCYRKKKSFKYMTLSIPCQYYPCQCMLTSVLLLCSWKLVDCCSNIISQGLDDLVQRWDILAFQVNEEFVLIFVETGRSRLNVGQVYTFFLWEREILVTQGLGEQIRQRLAKIHVLVNNPYYTIQITQK